MSGSHTLQKPLLMWPAAILLASHAFCKLMNTAEPCVHSVLDDAREVDVLELADRLETEFLSLARAAAHRGQ